VQKSGRDRPVAETPVLARLRAVLNRTVTEDLIGI